jgi:hypothetical protein
VESISSAFHQRPLTFRRHSASGHAALATRTVPALVAPGNSSLGLAMTPVIT